MAPGILVLAAWNPKKPLILLPSIAHNIQLSSDFNAISGTSMSCPHASGLAALLIGAHPEWSPAAIRSAVMTTVNPLDNSQHKIKDTETHLEIATPLTMGSGQVVTNRALNPRLYTMQQHMTMPISSSRQFYKKIKFLPSQDPVSAAQTHLVI
ncbi:hypothetical protein DCAR_0624909 [Daucus carota subsp. sativus]|uniref:Peptidase S8/S53 domain-containing protein n=1 Tax=Daucus carota subsp. sativus TaxID=79200 RepID=A0A164W3Y2_DAUCS|nr:hypothetical protein DCAR_0624909 [Daucus carota subsp. sativus]